MHRRVLAGILTVVLGYAGMAGADPVDCSTLIATCSVDACHLPRLEVISPCEVDFGSRALFIEGTLRVPAGGVLSFTAQEITASGTIRGGNGSQVTLEADPLTLRIEKPVKLFEGQLTLRGGLVDVAAPVKLKTRPGELPSTLSIESGSLVYLRDPIRLNGRRSSADGGSVTIQAADLVWMFNKIDVSGLGGGSIEISSAGDLQCDGCWLSARGGIAGGGTIRATANDLFFDTDLGLEARIVADADGDGGEIRLRATGSEVEFDQNELLDVHGGGGIIEITAPSLITLTGTTLRAAPGGCIAFVAPTVWTYVVTTDVTPVGDCPGSPSGAFVDG